MSSSELTEATSDLNWVVRQLAASFIVPPAPSSVPPAPSSVPPASSDVHDTSRGKRKVKLTEKALESGDRVQKRFCR
jgi:hypothetical protein